MDAEARSCPSCQAACPEPARFCPLCGTYLVAHHTVPAERRMVTTLFADLVGFTALNEQMDPEDVDLALRDFFTMARGAIERFGGVVEKYIGDAVAGVFGVTTVHEDDAERGVRAGLAIVDGMASLSSYDGHRLQVRVGVTTGRSLVRLGIPTTSGEGFLVGDAVNTAARLLATARPMSVVAGDLTHELSARALDYEKLPPLKVKGKTEPVAAWRAHSTAARRGADFDRSGAASMVGREVELGVLKGLFERTIASSEPQCALIVGEAGIGKSRLVHEFGQELDRDPGVLCTWREGSSPPYGEGLAFWPLREMIRAHAGILQTDEPVTVERKLLHSLGEACDEWMVKALRSLLGLPAEQMDREESLAAWSRFFEGLARERPTVLVFEDLHWASEAMVAFVGDLLDGSDEVPLLVLVTARPEFEAAHPTFADRPTVRTMGLRSLDRRETARLVTELPGSGAVPDLADLAFLRCGGNPLFTEEFVRYVIESVARGPSEGLAPDRVRVPDSLRALIAARLEALPPAHKALLQDAAVVGQVFWPGALTAFEEHDAGEVERILADLDRREFVHARSTSTMAGQREYAFGHAVIRDVAYEQLPRGPRAGRHAAVGRWIDATPGLGGAVSELRAYHFAAAYDLADSSGMSDLAEEVRGPAVLALRAAGDEALSADVARAEQHFSRAALMTRPTDAIRAHLTVGLAEAQVEGGDAREGIARLRQGIAELEAGGDTRSAAVALARLCSAIYWQAGEQTAEATEARERALALLQHDEPSAAKVQVLEECAVHCARDYRFRDAVHLADQAISMNDALGHGERVRSLAYRGMAVCCLGDRAGLQQLRRARELAMRRGEALDADAACQLLAELTYGFRGPKEALSIARSGHEYAMRRGGRLTPMWFRQQIVEFLRLSGDWDGALSEALAMEAVGPPGMSEDVAGTASIDLAYLRLLRGELDEARRRVDGMGDYAELGPWVLREIAPLAAALDLAEGNVAGVAKTLARVRPMIADRTLVAFSADYLPLLVRVALGAGDPELVRPLVDPVGTRAIDRCAALTFAGLEAERSGRLAEAEATLAEAAAVWSAFGNPWERALAQRDRGRCLLGLGRATEATRCLTEARDTFVCLGARLALEDAERLLSRARGAGPH